MFQVPSLVNEKEERGEDGTIVVCLVDPGSYLSHFGCNRLPEKPIRNKFLAFLLHSDNLEHPNISGPPKYFNYSSKTFWYKLKFD